MAVTQNEAGLYEATLHGKTYEFEKWGADDALRTLTELTGLVGMPMLQIAVDVFFNGKEGSVALRELSPSVLTDAAKGLFARMTDDTERVLRVIKKLASHRTHCNGKPVKDFDLHYKGQLPLMFSVVRANIEVQYTDFLGDAADLVGLVRRPADKAASANTTDKTPTP